MTQDELDSELLEICESTEDRSKELKMLIILVSHTFDNFNELIRLCCKARNLEHIKILVKSGGDIYGVLLYASVYGYLDGVKYAIENGADIHDCWDGRVLSDSIFLRNLDIVKILIKSGADIHVRGDSPLRTASDFGYLDVVKYLVENGANIHVNDDEPLRLASQSGHDDVVEYLKSLSKQETKCD